MPVRRVPADLERAVDDLDRSPDEQLLSVCPDPEGGWVLVTRRVRESAPARETR